MIYQVSEWNGFELWGESKCSHNRAQREYPGGIVSVKFGGPVEFVEHLTDIENLHKWLIDWGVVSVLKSIFQF